MHNILLKGGDSNCYEMSVHGGVYEFVSDVLLLDPIPNRDLSRIDEYNQTARNTKNSSHFSELCA